MAGLLSSAVASAADGLEFSTVRVGIGEAYKVGYWTPVWITVRGGAQPFSGRLAVETPDPDGTPARFELPGEPFDVAAGAMATVLRYVKFGRTGSGLTVIATSAEGAQQRRRFPAAALPAAMRSNGQLIVTLGADIGVDAALGSERENPDTASVHVTEPDWLPADWYGYQSVDTVVVTTSEPLLFTRLSEAQQAALREWVRLGGRLILTVGSAGERIFAAADNAANETESLGRLREYIPGDFVDVVTVTNASALENYARAQQPLELNERDRLELTMLSAARGRVELLDLAVSGEQPMIVRSAFGLGQVVFVAFDLDQPPLADWPGRDRITAQLLFGETATQASATTRPQVGKVSHVGYRDLVGQLRSALDQFPGVSFVSFSWVAGIILVYIVLIGPLDYLFLKNVLGRMQFTWITFPLVAIFFALGAAVLNQQLKGDRLLVNQVDVVDVDVAGGLARGTTWAHIYSPRTRKYDLELRPALLGEDVGEPPQSLLAWQGLPGSGLGGMEGASSSSAFDQPYTVKQAETIGTMRDLPIQVASTMPLHGTWWMPTAKVVETELTTTPDGLLEGEIVNPLPVELNNCLVLYSVWAYRLERTRGTLRPQQKTRVDAERPLNLEWRLTRRRVLDKRNVTTPWDPQSLDVPRLLEVMMFHTAAGGDDYTQLAHRYQRTIDLSDQLRTGSAILLGQASAAGSDLEINGETSHAGDRWTFCRIVFPVKKPNSANP